MCKHNWVSILPPAEVINENQRTDYAVEKFLARMNDIVYCDKCNHTGHYIKSHRGGIRRHWTGSYLIQMANKIREKFKLPLLRIEQKLNNKDI